MVYVAVISLFPNCKKNNTYDGRNAAKTKDHPADLVSSFVGIQVICQVFDAVLTTVVNLASCWPFIMKLCPRVRGLVLVAVLLQAATDFFLVAAGIVPSTGIGRDIGADLNVTLQVGVVSCRELHAREDTDGLVSRRKWLSRFTNNYDVSVKRGWHSQSLCGLLPHHRLLPHHGLLLRGLRHRWLHHGLNGLNWLYVSHFSLLDWHTCCGFHFTVCGLLGHLSSFFSILITSS